MELAGRTMEGWTERVGAAMVRMSEEKWSKLMLSIVIDIIGILSYLIPVVSAGQS